MSRLHKKMVALGDLSRHTYDSIVESCGEPKSERPFEFTDVGTGKQATWSDGPFAITLNFTADGKYCGIAGHRNLWPHLWLGLFTVVVILGAVIYGAVVRSRADAGFDSAEAMADAIFKAEDVWLDGDTAGAGLLDYDGDGDLEFVVTDTETVYVEALGGDYYGGCTVKIYALSPRGLTPVVELPRDDYCFTATVATPSGDARAMQNEAWVSPSGAQTGLDAIEADILTLCEVNYNNMEAVN